MRTRFQLQTVALALSVLSLCHGFLPVQNMMVATTTRSQRPSVTIFSASSSSSSSSTNTVNDDDPESLQQAYQKSFQIIDACSTSGVPTEDLYDAVRVIDKNAFKLYPNLLDKHALWDRTHGSWKLQLATGGGKFKTFKPVPIFAFAVIDEQNFGNGIGLGSSQTILLSLRGPHEFSAPKRQMILGIDDVFLWKGQFKMTESLPAFVKEKMGLGKRAQDYRNMKQRPPAFTIIGASEKSLIARGGSGGIAIWTRLDHDIRPLAYGDVQDKE